MTLDSASVHSLRSSLKCLNRLCLTVFSSLWSSLLLVHIFLPDFFLPVNFVFNMLWYSTPWTPPPPSLSVMTLCDLLSLWRVSLIVFWTIVKSSVFSIIVLSKNKRCPEFILYGCHLLKLKCKYSNILRTDFWLSLAVSSNYQNYFFKCFTLHVMNLEYESFTFWNKLPKHYAKCITVTKMFLLFHNIIFFLNAPVHENK